MVNILMQHLHIVRITLIETCIALYRYTHHTIVGTLSLAVVAIYCK